MRCRASRCSPWPIFPSVNLRKSEHAQTTQHHKSTPKHPKQPQTKKHMQSQNRNRNTRIPKYLKKNETKRKNKTKKGVLSRPLACLSAKHGPLNQSETAPSRPHPRLCHPCHDYRGFCHDYRGFGRDYRGFCHDCHAFPRPLLHPRPCHPSFSTCRRLGCPAGACRPCGVVINSGDAKSGGGLSRGGVMLYTVGGEG